ncbi:MAG: cell wall hydrolase [Rhodobacteraceae bacterium]|nr:cell wall hydrolase [Paracoccaceae bacterium]
MRRSNLLKAVCIAGIIGHGGLAEADVVLSESNAPGILIDSRLEELLSKERLALGKLNTARLERLATLPETRRFVRGQPATLTYTRGWLDTLPDATGDANWRCLSQALYFEARGERVRGQFAVAEVILNRVDSVHFPSSLCGVINQGTGRKYQCQFSYTCDGHDEVVREKAAFARVSKIARLMIDGAERALTRGATHYHTKAVNPNWARTFPRTTTIGVHHFYRMPTRVSRKTSPIPWLQ